MKGNMSTLNKFIRAIKMTWLDERDGFVIIKNDALAYAKKQYGFDIYTDQNHELAWIEALKVVKDTSDVKEIL